MNKKLIYVTHICVLYLFDYVTTVPPYYCLQRFNSSNCNGTPTPVFSYYKPGSRCEIEFWRGCPTMNMFVDQYQCSHFCIGRFLNMSNDTPTTKESTCYEIFNGMKCATRIVKVYTYNAKTKRCESVIWRGCKTGNMFLKEKTCISTCETYKKEGYEDKLNYLLPGDAKKVDSILDEVIGKDNGLLKYKVTTEKYINDNNKTILKVTDSLIEGLRVTDGTVAMTSSLKAMTTTAEVARVGTTSAETTMGHVATETTEVTEKSTVTATSIRQRGTVEEVVVPNQEYYQQENKLNQYKRKSRSAAWSGNIKAWPMNI